MPTRSARTIICGLLAIVAACSSTSSEPSTPPTPPIPPEGALFEVMACRGSRQAPEGEKFKVRIIAPDVVAQATERIDRGMGLIISGKTLAGDGGYNQPWTWHFDSSTIQFAEGTVEGCDGCPSWVEAGHPLGFCPWSTEVLGRIE